VVESDPLDDLNENENNERMLEDDFDWIKELENMEIMREKAFEELNSRQANSEIISFEDIEDFRKLLNIGWNHWKTIQSKKDRRNKTSKSELYFLEMLEKNADKNIYEQNIHLEQNLNRLDYSERFLLYKSWVDKYKQIKQEEINKLIDDYNQAAQSLQELRLQEDRSILQDAYIVAMTTTGSSRYHSILKDIGPRIVIVEEAAEVFESHIVASLSKNCEHLILIGDHVQLRPNPAVYKLATDFKLNVSLFERLINNDTKKVL